MEIEALNIAGERLFNILLDIAYWIILLAGVTKVIKCVSKGDVEGVMKNAVLYGACFAALFLMRWTLDLIRTVFG